MARVSYDDGVMTSGGTQRWARGVGLFLVVVLWMALAPPGAVGMSPAHAAKPTPELQRAQITFDAMTPTLPAREGRITLSGTVKNTTDEPISNLQVLLWRDQSPITAADGMQAAIESEATTPFGSRMVTEGAYQDITSDAEPSLPPGEERRFTVSADVADLELPSTGGVYLVGAHALGQLGAGGVETLGRNRLFMPLPSGDEAGTPQQVVDLVVLSSEPHRDGSGAFLDDSLTKELSSGGRLRLLLDAAARPKTSWVIDPALFDAVRRMAEGYALADGGRPEGQQVAQAWLKDFEALDRANGFRSTYLLPDASAIAHGEKSELWDRVRGADARVKGLKDLPVLDVSGGGRLDHAGVKLLAQQDPIAILASTAASEHTLLTPIGDSDAPIVAFDPDAFTGGPGPDPTGTELHRRQRLLADTWIAAANDKTEPTVRLVATGVDARALTGADAPWQRPMTMREMLAGQRFEWSQRFDYTEVDSEREAIAASSTAIGAAEQDISAVQSLLSNDPTVPEQTDRALAGLASSCWRGRSSGLSAHAQRLRHSVASLLDGQGVSLAVAESVTMIARDGGSFPATVRNDLDVPVVVAIHFQSDQPQRLDVPSLTGIEVPPNSTTTVTVRPEANANGPVQVRARLETQDGTPLGRATPILVNATNLGAVGWIIVGASGFVLVLTTALRIRQVRREQARALEATTPALPSGTDPDDTTQEAAMREDPVEVADGERRGS